MEPKAGPPRTADSSDLPSGSADRDETIAAPTSADAGAAPPLGLPAAAGEVGTLGPYRIVKELGRGGMGAVYAAVDTRLGRRLAVKVMLPQFAANPAYRERFLREARAAAGIKHDNVVTLYEADVRDGVPYIAMEFLEGYTLDGYLRKRGGPTIPQVLRIAAGVAAGLAAAHKIGLVHRDIKPGNLWLEAPNGRVKVLDFGLAKPVDAAVELTASGAVVGTPAYMSPEQARGEKVDHRTDLFSLGAVMYQLCAGRLPFQGATAMAVLMALGTEEPTPVRELNPDVPEPLAALIHQLLAKRPDARPPSAAEVVKRVRAVAEGLAVPRAVPTGHPTSQPQMVFAPMQVTVPPPEQNPFADLDGSVTELASGESTAPVTALKLTRKTPAGRFPWVVAGALAVGALAIGGVIILIKHKDGTETKIEVPDGATVTVKGKDGKTLAKVGPGEKPPPPAADADRKVAEWALSLGGEVRVKGTGKEIKAVADLPKDKFTLTWVAVGGKEVTDADLVRLKELKDLRSLFLDHTQVTDAGLAHLKPLTLDWLALHSTRVTDAGLAHLKGIEALGGLGLSETRVTDAGLSHLKDIRFLSHLQLTGSKVTDAGLGHLVEVKGLTELFLPDTAVTDAGLARLGTLKTLTQLDVRKTRVTAKGLAEFHAAVPGCKVVHDGGVIEPKK